MGGAGTGPIPTPVARFESASGPFLKLQVCCADIPLCNRNALWQQRCGDPPLRLPLDKLAPLRRGFFWCAEY